jgi:hypothetical protein
MHGRDFRSDLDTEGASRWLCGWRDRRHELKSLLQALLIKTPQQQEIFEPLFNDWCPDTAADWAKERTLCE